ncbi:uncharacterized protein DI49_3029 [Saccharomyces eubayanus]|uniref:uncharacterized protein n=1 Tax=Saccharomyces eubayanus TaxID=1080349 RepID=UPI0006BECDC6|nr:hypothetical protein DI49_3029 [Saccharomyces eubayanus]KOG98607.1 hypothetical protein DI49_3029 [Saccharomyces eubayanus]
MAGDELSYEELLDHILNNKPIPNIVEVPNVTLDESLSSSPSLKPRTRPWERQQQQHQSGNDARQQSQEVKTNVPLDFDEESLEKMTSPSKLSECYDIQSKLGMNFDDDDYNSNDKVDG